MYLFLTSEYNVKRTGIYVCTCLYRFTSVNCQCLLGLFLAICLIETTLYVERE